MAKITIDVPNEYADELGYQSVIANPDYVPQTIDLVTGEVLTEAVGRPTIENPETKGNFLKRKIPKIIVSSISDRAVKVLERTRKNELKTEIETLKDQIESSLSTT